MKTMTIIFLIRRVDYLMTELIKFNSKSDNELDKLVTLYNRTFDVMKLAINNNWMRTDVNQLRQELTDFQYNMYNEQETKLIRKYYERNYWAN